MLDFSSIIGHEDIVKHFKMSMELNKMNHAYILNGERDSGKKTLVRVVSKALLCEENQADPCNKCRSCLQADSGNHPDIIWVKHEKPNVISVNDIRDQVNASVAVKPYQGKYKIYIIPDAELMNNQAQNALLKTIEEPPEYVIIFLLTSNMDRILDTISSRCINLNIKPVRQIEVLDYLKNELGVSEEKAYFCMEYSFGNLGKAIRLATSTEYNEIKDAVISIMEQIYTMEMEDIIVAVQSLAKYDLEISESMDMMLMWYRDILMVKVSNSANKLVFKEEYSVMRKQSNHISYEGIETVIKAIEKAKVRLEANVRKDILLELLLLTIKENYND